MSWDLSKHDARDKALAPSRRKAVKPKNTRRWCRGKVGAEHTPAIVMGQSWGRECMLTGSFDTRTRIYTPNSRWLCFHVQACTTCGKHLKDVVLCPDAPEGIPPSIVPA